MDCCNYSFGLDLHSYKHEAQVSESESGKLTRLRFVLVRAGTLSCLIICNDPCKMFSRSGLILSPLRGCLYPLLGLAWTDPVADGKQQSWNDQQWYRATWELSVGHQFGDNKHCKSAQVQYCADALPSPTNQVRGEHRHHGRHFDPDGPGLSNRIRQLAIGSVGDKKHRQHSSKQCARKTGRPANDRACFRYRSEGCLVHLV